MRSESSTNWATSPCSSSFEVACEQNSWKISFRFVTSCQFFPFVSQNKIELSKPQKCIEMRGNDPRTSHAKRALYHLSYIPYPSSFKLTLNNIHEISVFHLQQVVNSFPLSANEKQNCRILENVLEMRGIDPRTSSMQSERSTVSATFPYSSSFELAYEQNPWNISFRFVTSCQFLPIISKHQIELSKPQKVLEMRGIDPRTSRMQSERSTISATFPYSSSFELASEQNSWNISCRFVTSCQFFPFVTQNKVEFSNPQICFGDAGHRSPTPRMRSESSTSWATSPCSSSFEVACEQNSW